MDECYYVFRPLHYISSPKPRAFSFGSFVCLGKFVGVNLRIQGCMLRVYGFRALTASPINLSHLQVGSY